MDRGFYADARRNGPNGEPGVHPMVHLTNLMRPEPPQVDAVKARLVDHLGYSPSTLQSSGLVLQNNLDRLAYQFTGLSMAMDELGIRGSQTVENAFFASNNGPGVPLFPVFLASQIIAGQMAGSLVPFLCAAEIPINSMVQEKITSTDTTATRQMGRVGEGDLIPKTTISRSEGTITLGKYARELDFTYESIKFMHLDIISLHLQRMGRQMGIDETDDLIETALAGDGNASTAVSFLTAITVNTLTYDELVRLFLAFPIGYQMRHAVINDTLLRTLLNMAEFKDPMAGFRFTREGVLPGPMGASWHRWTSTGSTTFGADRILAVDDRLALACYTNGDLLEESDQLIDRQIARRTMSYFRGYMKLDNSGSQALKLA
jgi:hypothetical protein